MIVREYYRLGLEYALLLDAVKDYGELVSPRGMKVLEIRPLVLNLREPRFCVVDRPGFSHAFMFMEIAQLLAGTFDKRLLETCSQNAASMLNAHGAYGLRTSHQLQLAIRELQRDPDSRRAMVYIGRPDDLELADKYDMTCTATLQFFVRGGELEMIVNMRSWDLVWGLSYDVPCFVSVQSAIAAALGLPLGTYTHVAGSAHVYERHFDMKPGFTEEELPPFGLSSFLDTQKVAKTALLEFLAALDDGTSLVLPRSWIAAIQPWQRVIDKARATT